MSDAAISIIFQLVGLFVPLSTAAWVLSQKLERLQACLEAHTRVMKERMKSLDREMSEVKGAIKESRAGRVEIWTAVNALRERTAVLETKTKTTPLGG